MKAYWVGGYVRDMQMNKLFGTSIVAKDRDWVVVGATEREMLDKGFTKVGNFPVFLHPQTKEEWALARTEKKSGTGYTGFEVAFSPDVTLEEDLLRRDLTINAMAQEPTTQALIDPYNGLVDLKNKVLRHVSPAFIEDPLRVVRVARFAARFNDFSLASDSLDLMTRITQSGELVSLTKERVWNEIHSALQEPGASRFFDVLEQCGALSILWPDIANLYQNKLIWSEVMDALAQSRCQNCESHIPFAVLCAKLPDLDNTLSNFKPPNRFKQCAKMSNQNLASCENIDSLSAESILELFNRLDAWRNPNHLSDFLTVCQCFGLKKQAALLRELANLCQAVSSQEFIQQGIQGAAIKEAMNTKRVTLMKHYIVDSGKVC